MKIFFLVSFVVLVIIIIAGFFWLKPRFLKTPDISTGRAVLPSTDQILAKTKDAIFNVTKETSNNINTAINKSLDNTSDAKVKVNVIPADRQVSENILTTIDVSANKNIALNLKKGEKYFLKFQNLPPDFCLLVGSLQVFIDSDSLVELFFVDSGRFPIKADFCNPTVKTLGQITVE